MAKPVNTNDTSGSDDVTCPLRNFHATNVTKREGKVPPSVPSANLVTQEHPQSEDVHTHTALSQVSLVPFRGKLAVSIRPLLDGPCPCPPKATHTTHTTARLSQTANGTSTSSKRRRQKRILNLTEADGTATNTILVLAVLSFLLLQILAGFLPSMKVAEPNEPVLAANNMTHESNGSSFPTSSWYVSGSQPQVQPVLIMRP